jgi:hypothetical protein
MFLLILAITLTGLAARQAGAATILQTGFEPPAFTTGALPGQNGWGQDIGPGGLINVQTSVVSSGAQAVQFQTILGLPIYTRATPPAASYDTTTGDSGVLVEMDIRLSSSGTPSLWRPFATFDGAHFIGAFDVLATGEIRASAASDQLSGVFLARDTWYRIGLLLNFSTFTLDALLNGSPVVSGLSFAGPTGSKVFGGFTIENVVSGTDSLFFDNLSASAVPEPSTLLSTLLAFGALVAFRRGRGQP